MVFKNVFSLFGVNEAERALAAIKMLNRGVGEDRVFAMTGANAATVAYVRNLGVASASELSFSQLVKLGTMNLKANTKQILANAAAWATSPLGMATIAAASIFLLAKGIDLFTTSLEESREALADLKEEYNSNQSKLDNLNSELQTTVDRIAELEGKHSLTFTEAEELDNLRKQNAELDRKIALLNIIQQQKAKERNDAFVETMDKDLANKKEYLVRDDLASSNYTTQYGTDAKRYGKGRPVRTMSERDLLNSALMRRTEIVDALSGELSSSERKKLEASLEEINVYLTEKSVELLDAAEGISYIESPTTDDERKVNEWLDFINDFHDKLMISSDSDGAKSNAVNRLIYGEFSDATKALRDLGAQGAVTAESFKTSELDAFIDKCIELGVIADNSDESLEFLALAFNDLNSSVSGAISDVSGSITDYASALSNFESVKDKIDSVSESLKTVADLQHEVANGFTISQEKALEFASVYPEILNGATNAADGQVTLNKDVVKSFIANKEDELKAQVDGQIAALEADKAALMAKKEFAEAQLKLALGVGEGEGKIAQDVAIYRATAGESVAKALIDAGVQEAEAYRLACSAMAGNAEEFNTVAAEVCTDVQGNFNQAAYNAAQAIYQNMNRAKTDVSSLTSQAHEAGRAIAAMGSGEVRGSAAIKAGSSGGVWLKNLNANTSAHVFDGVDTPTMTLKSELEDFISQLKLDIADYEDAIEQIDGQIAVLRALRERDLGSFKSEGKSSGNKDADNAIAEAEEALRNGFKDYLNDMEHFISLMERNNVPEAEIVDAYKRMMEAVHAEAERARANGEDENSDYIQDLQDQWWEYHDAIQEIRDEITENAKSAVDELVDYRIDMLKQELEDEKDALDERLDQLKEFYDEQKEMLRDQYDEEKYLEEQAEKRKAISDINADLESLKYDDSAWAQKRRAELEAELADARKDLEDFEKENALDEVEKMLDEQYEQQAELIQSQIDAIEAQLNDPEALFNQALADIKNSTEDLYQEMVAYNATHGDGNPETVKQFWEEAYSALQEYLELFGKAYDGVNMENATGYESQRGSVNVGGSDSGSGSGTSSGNTGGGTSSGSTGSTSAPAKPDLEKGSYVKVKDGVKWYSNSNGSGKWGYAKSGKIKYINESGTHPYNIDGAGWVRKEDIVGYASGTSNTTAGLHEFGERGDEFIFTSGDGRKYRIFSDGEKVLNAGATNFLYDFANSYGDNMRNVWDSLVGSILKQVGGIGSRGGDVEIHEGDIIIQGNTDERTLSEIRRIKREQVSFMLKELGKLNK